ncbi:hypothetical protein KL915_004537 [Ogataea haglerorum]|nr:hypothetical protein KL915_004537 [Ogataea haglerorum]
MFDPRVHVRYFLRCLGVLPSIYEAEESNKLALIYFCVCGLDLLNALDQLPEKVEMIDWVYSHWVENDDYGGFRGSAIYRDTGPYDVPNLAATGFALQILVTLGDNLSRLDRNKARRFVARCQRPNGSFSPVVGFGEEDLRYCMLAMTISRLLEGTAVDSGRLFEYVRSTLAFDGGLSMSAGGESHAGLTYCGLAALKLAGRLDLREWQPTVDFLVQRQIHYGDFNERELENEYADEDDNGAFNGRVNKYGDTCYAFWCLAALELLGKADLVDAAAVKRFLLEQTLSPTMGGFCKTNAPDELPDPLHSFLGVAALGIIGTPGIAPVDVTVVLRKDRVV